MSGLALAFESTLLILIPALCASSSAPGSPRMNDSGDQSRSISRTETSAIRRAPAIPPVPGNYFQVPRIGPRMYIGSRGQTTNLGKSMARLGLGSTFPELEFSMILIHGSESWSPGTRAQLLRHQRFRAAIRKLSASHSSLTGRVSDLRAFGSEDSGGCLLETASYKGQIMAAEMQAPMQLPPLRFAFLLIAVLSHGGQKPTKVKGAFL
ncbi:hypothetical protein FB45DRAFT_872804 [Roridomyces roridus]|uniref:Uncharacterized protein n=1 Tax=Roridomyces roridus TaxID=1738132 RepID=A0AAD7BD58_9AGAR|nr:hypothetical protein FB45DRAFT_872804 [Roridomyces roridus]